MPHWNSHDGPHVISTNQFNGEPRRRKERVWWNQKPPNKHTFYEEKNSKTQINSVAAMNLSPVSLTGSHRHHFESFRTNLGLGLPRFCLPLSRRNSLVTISLYPFRLTLALSSFSSVEVGLKSVIFLHYSQALSSQTLSLLLVLHWTDQNEDGAPKKFFLSSTIGFSLIFCLSMFVMT